MKTLGLTALLAASILRAQPAPAAEVEGSALPLPAAAEAAAAFASPPAQYGSIHWAIWGGPQSREQIAAEMAQLHANGARVVMLNASRGLRPAWLSPEYLDLVRFLVSECKRYGMKLWLEDDAGYPSGFAGGAISSRHPELRMQGLVADVRVTVVAGQTVELPLPPGTVGILAWNRSAAARGLPLPPDGLLRWTADLPGASTVVFVRHVFRSSPTRYTNRSDGTNNKDALYSLIDYLNPAATAAFLVEVHERFGQAVGSEFGHTILGFRGDEPDYTGFLPWTPALLGTFRRIKGYDLQPYLAALFAPEFTEQVRRVRADYWDVWSQMFRDNFFRPQEAWCRAHGMEYMVHLNHEELMLDLHRGEDLVRNEGSFFRDMRYVGVPGVDNLNQIGPGIVADFPKLAASAAHAFGRAQVWNEEGGGLDQAGKFVADYNFVRGLNFLQIRGLNRPGASAVRMAAYVNRASYLLTLGRPAAQVALFHPTDSLWLGDKEPDDVAVRLATQLMEHQIDFDQIDSDTISDVLQPHGNTLVNVSGSAYRAVIVPSTLVIQRSMREALARWAAQGGRVIVVGRPPTWEVDRTFLHSEPHPPDLRFAALHEPEPELTAQVIRALPQPDVALDQPTTAIKYLHRTWADGDLYFFFNESAASLDRVATLAASGQAQLWSPEDGSRHVLRSSPASAGRLKVRLELGPYESRFVICSAQVPGAAGPWADSSNASVPVARDAGAPATFHFEVGAGVGGPLLLDLGEAHEIVTPAINGQTLPVKAWPPYVWDVSAFVHAGSNTLSVSAEAAPRSIRPNYLGNRPAPVAYVPHRFVPTGVPGGLGLEDPFAGRPARGSGPAGLLSATPPEAPTTSPPPAGVIGPVRLLIAGSAKRTSSEASTNILDHGAVADGKTMNTQAIQSAIDACSAGGGGWVVIPPGTFVSGALYFKPGVNLRLEHGAVLKSTTMMADFPSLYTRWEGAERYWTASFLNFIGMDRVRVEGDGTIDGSGDAWSGFGPRRRGAFAPPPPAPPQPLPRVADVYPGPLPSTDRLCFAPDPAHLPIINAAGVRIARGPNERLAPPRAVMFQNCTHVRISGVHLLNQARWGFVFLYCSDVVADHLTVRAANYIPSSDGLDVDSCRQVVITGCDIVCNDDAISIKSGRDEDGRRVHRPTEDVIVENTRFGYAQGGVAIGSETSGDIRRVETRDCLFEDGNWAPVRLKTQPSRGGVIEDITYRDLTIKNVARAFELDLAWNMKINDPRAIHLPPKMRRIRLVNVSGTARSVGLIHGLPDQPITDVAFVNCHLSAEHPLTLSNTEDIDLSGLDQKVTPPPATPPAAAPAP